METPKGLRAYAAERYKPTPRGGCELDVFRPESAQGVLHHP
jgi:hypothetical protein